MLARDGIWRGPIRELRQRMADFTVDGIRFGELSPSTVSGSPHDRRLTKRSEEIVTAAFILGRLGHERVKLTTKAADGQSLERPDLDASFSDGTTAGIEIAQVGSTRRMKHDAQIALLEHRVCDLIETDQSFADAFGAFYLSVSPANVLGERDAVSKKQIEAMIEEVVRFVRAGEHSRTDSEHDPDTGYFPRGYSTLHARGATYYASAAAYGPHFQVTTGGTVNPRPETAEVLRVLDDHRAKAIGYRHRRNWLLLYLPDSNEVFRGTVAAIASEKPEIAPFEKCYITDACWRLATLS